MNILVTGGLGYIGSTLVGLLLRNGHDVTVLDSLRFGGEAMLGLWHSAHFKFIKGDITSEDVIQSVFKDHRFQAAVHLAAIVGDPACAKEPELAKRVNWDAARKILNYAIESKVKRFIFASTCSNYGKMSDSTKYVDETSALTPVSLYAELKVKFEKFILNEIKQTDSFCPTALRFATAYGISPRMRFDLTLNEFTKELALKRELEVFGEQFWRPYCHVYDLARGVLCILKSEEKKITYQAFNVGNTDENYQKKMLIERIKDFIPDSKVKFVKKDEDPRDYRVSFEKIKRELGFQTSKKVTDGIKEIKYLIDNAVLSDPDD